MNDLMPFLDDIFPRHGDAIIVGAGPLMMRVLFLIALIIGVPQAHADVSDSGNLSIGGNGVIAGSMTVSGAGGLGVAYGLTASSVTAASGTFTATGSNVYALTSSSGVHVLNGLIKLEPGAYIQWADGSTSTTTAGGACANCFMLNSTQTVSGNTTITSTLTVSGSMVVSGIDEQWQTGSAGNGSTGVRCKVFSTTLISSGTNITYTSDSVNGDKWTINKSGVYAVSYHGVASAPDDFAISHNNASCTTQAQNLPESNTLCYVGPNSNIGSCSFVGWLVAGDVLKAHQSGSTGISGYSSFVVHRLY